MKNKKNWKGKKQIEFRKQRHLQVTYAIMDYFKV